MLLYLYLQFWSSSFHGADYIQVNSPSGQQQYDLKYNRVIIVEGFLGDSKLQIYDGQVRFLQSPCTNQYCVHHGWLQHKGEFFACLPNQISLQLMGKRQFDAIGF